MSNNSSHSPPTSLAQAIIFPIHIDACNKAQSRKMKQNLILRLSCTISLYLSGVAFQKSSFHLLYLPNKKTNNPPSPWFYTFCDYRMIYSMIYWNNHVTNTMWGESSASKLLFCTWYSSYSHPIVLTRTTRRIQRVESWRWRASFIKNNCTMCNAWFVFWIKNGRISVDSLPQWLPLHRKKKRNSLHNHLLPGIHFSESFIFCHGHHGAWSTTLHSFFLLLFLATFIRRRGHASAYFCHMPAITNSASLNPLRILSWTPRYTINDIAFLSYVTIFSKFL